MIDSDKINHIAKLARLKITPEEASAFSQQISTILDSFEKISKVNTEGVEPLVTPTDIVCVLREDNEEQEFTTEELMQNAPARVGKLFKVPPVV